MNGEVLIPATLAAVALLTVWVAGMRGLVGKGRITRRILPRLDPGSARLAEVLGVLAASFSVGIATGGPLAHCLYWGSMVVLFGDDLLTGDDDRWKRWKSKARNAVKWRMKLPALSREPSAA